MLTVTLYTKPDCSLCDLAADYLALRQETYPHELVEVDISAEPDLNARYRFIIPVLEIGDTRLKAPITNGEIEAALRVASN